MQNQELGVPPFNKATLEREDFTESELGFEVGHPQRGIQRVFHLNTLRVAFVV